MGEVSHSPDATSELGTTATWPAEIRPLAIAPLTISRACVCVKVAPVGCRTLSRVRVEAFTIDHASLDTLTCAGRATLYLFIPASSIRFAAGPKPTTRRIED